MSRSIRFLLFAIITVSLLFALGCKRSPEDLEQWRNARGGMEQLAEWANSDRESLEVRIRAVQIIIEEGHSDRVPRILNRLDDLELRQTVANATMATIETMWAKQDIPELTEELRASGGQVALGQSEATLAKDAVYRLHEFYDDEHRAKANAILREWMSKDQELRTQFGDATIPMLISRTGDDAVELLQDWIQETYDPQELTAQLRRFVDGEEGHRLIDEAVVTLAMSEHPELRRETQHAVVGAQSPAIAPYLEKAILSDEISNELLQASLDTIATAVGPDAAPFLSRVIAERRGILRWASANALLDAKKTSGLVDIAAALPADSGSYDTTRDGDFRRYVEQICNYYALMAEREGIEDSHEPILEILAMDTWPAQTIGLECASRSQVVAARERVQELTAQSQQLPGWGERQTLGQFATSTYQSLSAIAEE